MAMMQQFLLHQPLHQVVVEVEVEMVAKGRNLGHLWRACRLAWRRSKRLQQEYMEASSNASFRR